MERIEIEYKIITKYFKDIFLFKKKQDKQNSNDDRSVCSVIIASIL